MSNGESDADVVSASVPDAPIAASAIRYLTVGGTTALLELGIFQVLFLITRGDVTLSNPIAVVCATAVNFALNRSWAFKSQAHIARSMVLYVLLFLFNMSFSTLVISWLVSIGGIPTLAKILTMACITSWNFVLYRRLIFK